MLGFVHPRCPLSKNYSTLGRLPIKPVLYGTGTRVLDSSFSDVSNNIRLFSPGYTFLSCALMFSERANCASDS